jgi:hypothetical protein
MVSWLVANLRIQMEVVACQDTLCQGEQRLETRAGTYHSTCRASHEGMVNFLCNNAKLCIIVLIASPWLCKAKPH